MVAQGADVVVVGGGLVGITTALWLQKAGRDVVVVERTRPGDGASGHNGGVFSLINCLPIGTMGNLRALPHLVRGPVGSVPIDIRHVPRMRVWGWNLLRSSGNASVNRIAAALAPLLKDALRAYDEILDQEQLDQIKEGGLLYVNRTAQAYDAGEWSRRIQRSVGLDFESVDEAWLQKFLPETAADFTKGTYVAGAPYVDSALEFNRAAADLFVRRGGRIVTARAQSFVVERGEVVGVQTTLDIIRGRHVVVAAGAWSQELSDQLGVRCLLDTERGYGYEFDEYESGLKSSMIDVDTHVAYTPRNNGLRIVGVSELADLRTPPRESSFTRVRTAAKMVFPDLPFEAAERWMSYRPSPPDSMPYIGALPRYSNVVAAFGHGHIGFTLAATTGRLVSEQILHGATSIDIAPFAPDRFTPRRRRLA